MNGIHQNHVEGQEFASHAAGSLKPIIVVGGGVVGCLTALKLAQAGIDVDIIEILPAPSKAPRACGYFAAVQQFLNELGVYKLIRDQGFMTRGLAWRNLPKGDGQGGKVLGDIVATLPLCARNDTVFEPGAGLLNLPQAPLNKLLLNEALKTGHVQVHFNTELVSIPENDTAGVTVVARDTNTGERKTYMAKYLVGTDGAHSATRKALGLSYPGHTWPERLIATDVLMKNVEDPYFHTHFAMDSKYFSISTPLADPVVGETTLWRFTLAADPHDTRTDDELLSDENIFSHYERNMPGPRPLQVQIQARAVYRTHQRLAPTMRRGNCLLAGDAAHCNHPFGGLGLNTGMLDADAAAEPDHGDQGRARRPFGRVGRLFGRATQGLPVLRRPDLDAEQAARALEPARDCCPGRLAPSPAAEPHAPAADGIVEALL